MVQPVASPEPAALRIGLVQGARRPPDNAGRWELGISYDPFFDHLGNEFIDITAADSGITGIDTDALDPRDFEKIIPDGQDFNTWLPYTIWLGEKCSTMSGLRDSFYRPRVTAALDVETSYRLEKSFSQGVIEISEGESYTFDDLGLPNRPLYSTAATELNSSAVVGIVEGLSLVVAAMADEMGSARGMVHVPAALLPYLDFYGQITRNPSDGRFITLKSHDHTVIAGSGYDGLAPDGTDPGDGVYWIYGTSPVEVRLGEIEVVERDLMDAVNIRQNDVEYHAERLALASWDLSCHVAIPVAALDPGPEITS